MKKTLTILKVLFFGQLEAHLGNLELFFGPIVCLYIVFDISYGKGIYKFSIYLPIE
jgi:hypothetical protein